MVRPVDFQLRGVGGVSEAPAAIYVTSPARPASGDDAVDRTEFAKKIAKMGVAEREQEIRNQIRAGNFPQFLRVMRPVTVRAPDGNGDMRRVTFFVMPDYLAVGSDDNFMRVAMLPATAQVLAKALGLALPTNQMVKDMHQAPRETPPADDDKSRTVDDKASAPRVTEVFRPLRGSDAYRVSSQGMIDHDLMVQEEGLPLPPGGIRSGTMKNICIPAMPGRLNVIGAFNASGKAEHDWPPDQQAHYDGYVDYSHGAQYVSRDVYVDGQKMAYAAVLADPVLAQLLNPGHRKGEGVISPTLPETCKSYSTLDGR